MPIITISRGSMSGGQALAEQVATALGVPCVGREIMVEASAKIGVPHDLLRQKLETSPGLWDRLTLERRMYVTAVQAALAETAASGNLVYHGYAGHLLLRGLPFVLRVRLIAPLSKRKQILAERQGLAPEAAEAHIRRVDEERARWTKFMYGVELGDPQLYDLVICLETMSLEGASRIVLEAVRLPEFAITEEAQQRLRDFGLACSVKLALATHPASRALELRVVAADGVVSLAGEPQSIPLARTSVRVEREVRSVVEGVPGVRTVRILDGIV
jgi:cytidylate kinase